MGTVVLFLLVVFSSSLAYMLSVLFLLPLLCFCFSQIIHFYVVSYETEVVIIVSSAFPPPLTFML